MYNLFFKIPNNFMKKFLERKVYKQTGDDRKICHRLSVVCGECFKALWFE